LGAAQTKCRQNWAVGFYNPIGGYVLGRIWSGVRDGTSSQPDLGTLPFPEGTVVAKALYTQSDATEVPLLAGAPTIQAHIVRDDTPNDNTCPSETDTKGKPSPRAEATLHLLQLDVAVRDARAPATGWAFGTFIYDGRLPGTDPWDKLRPVGLMWGNDPGLADADVASGKKPAEGVVLSDFGLGRAFGRSGRMNGPVDNPVSSCLSCHSTAEFPSSAPMTPGKTDPWTVASCWFRDLPGTRAFGGTPTPALCGAVNGQKSLDYSLQLAVGARNVAVSQLNEDRGFNVFGMKLFGGKALLPDQEQMIEGLKSYPISRDEAVVAKGSRR
jgi:hypothetical protein